MNGKPFHKTLLARIIGYIFIAYLFFITVVKMTGLDSGRVPWSNVISTYFFATVYCIFVFPRRRNRF